MKILKYKWVLWLLLLLPIVSGCNNSDDVMGIFTGKVWKLNYITLKDGKDMFNFWGNDDNAREARKKSLEILGKEGTYTISFTGTETDNVVKGNVNGKAVIVNFTGSWSANGENNDFKAAVTGGKESDLLAVRFLEGLNTATSYSGDSSNLYIYYKMGQQTLCLVFYPLSK